MAINSEYVFAKVGFVNSNSHAGIGIKVQKLFQNVSQFEHSMNHLSVGV